MRVVAMGGLMHGMLRAQQLHIAPDVHVEQQRELAVEMIPGKRGHPGQPVYTQRIFQMRVDVCKYGAEADEIAVGGDGQVGLLGGDTLARVMPPCLAEVTQQTLVSGGVSYLKPSGALHGLERAGVDVVLPQCGLPAYLACTLYGSASHALRQRVMQLPSDSHRSGDVPWQLFWPC